VPWIEDFVFEIGSFVYLSCVGSCCLIYSLLCVIISVAKCGGEGTSIMWRRHFDRGSSFVPNRDARLYSKMWTPVSFFFYYYSLWCG
jgi:hypothetical protein